MSSKFTRKQEFKLKKIEKPIYVRNMDGMFNKKGLIENTVEVNIFHKEGIAVECNFGNTIAYLP